MKDDYEKDYFPDGCIKSEGEYVYGQMDGVWKFYYDEGMYYTYSVEDTLRIEMFYTEGSKNGYYKSYFLGRKLKCEGQYHFNLKDGIWTHYNIQGKLIKVEVYKLGELVEQKDY